MATYIWQLSDWNTDQKEDSTPNFRWDEDSLRPQLEAIAIKQGRLLGQAGLPPENAQQRRFVHYQEQQAHLAPDYTQQAQLDALVQSALRTSEIEGELLDRDSVRASVVRQLGLSSAGVAPKRATETPQSRALVQMLIAATSDIDRELDIQTLCQWQAALFPEVPVLTDINVGSLRGDAPMQVVSGSVGRFKVHFEAPPRSVLDFELSRFLFWFNRKPSELHGLLRAGIAHLWLLILHPFDDGNGRVTRAVTDRALAQAESSSIRYYSLSAAIMARRSEYYEQLEAADKGTLDITQWLAWFLSIVDDAIESGLQHFQRVLDKTRFWQLHGQTVLSERQIKVLNRLLDTRGEEFTRGINAGKYGAVAKVSKATATRDLADLVKKGCLVKLPGGGRSTRYSLVGEDRG